jgi:diguanylate cyclase (GGDEF)-like protein
MKNDFVFPVPSGVLARVIELASSEICDVGELSTVVASDPVLSTQLLRAVNSPYYGLRRKIQSADRAVAVMGIRAVRNLILCFGVQKLSPNNPHYPLELFWECSLRRAVAARSLANLLGAPGADELFTLGLSQDLAVLVLVAGHERSAQTLAEVARRPRMERLQAEAALGATHDALGAEMFERWSFPADIVIPTRYHHRPAEAPEEHRTRARIACAADALADLLEVDDKKAALDAALSDLEALGVEQARLGPILDEISLAVADAADMLQIRVGHQQSFQEIAMQASQGLMSLHMSYHALTEQLQESLTTQRRLTEQLEGLNRDLERRALTDELTGLPNRRAFDEAMERESERSQRLGQAAAVMMADIDRFKRVNDVHGHLAGDAVLREVGRAIMACTRACDFAARYGGEEFVIILPHTSMDGAAVAAERLRSCVEGLRVEHEGRLIPVTISIGVAPMGPDQGQGRRASTIALRAADDALYEAKESGRNRVVAGSVAAA